METIINIDNNQAKVFLQEEQIDLETLKQMREQPLNLTPFLVLNNDTGQTEVHLNSTT